MKKNIVEFKSLVVELGNKIILENISFSFDSQSSVCIIGEGSSGKTTLVKSLMGLIPIKSGEILINENSINKTNYSRIHCFFDEFGVVFQKDALFDSLTVWQNIMFRKLDSGFSKKELIFRSSKLLDKVGMESSTNHLYPAELSGGMKKRVAIARAVCNKPKFLILDEPTAGLDPVKTNKIFKIIHDLSEELNVSVLSISSDMKGALKYFKKLVFLRNSRIQWIGATKNAKKVDDSELQRMLKRT